MSKTNQVRGVLEGQEIRHNNWRDSRTFGEKFSDGLENPQTTLVILCVAAAIIFIYPALAEITFIIALLFFRSISSKKLYLPFRMPKSSGLIDYNSPTPNPKKPYDVGTGIMFLGNEMGTRKELWVNDSDARTHFLIFGSTGAGKALRNEEDILTPNGWIKNKNIEVGDYVVRPTGEFTKVIGVYPQGISQLYNFELEDGRIIPVTSDHLWEIYDYEEVEDCENNVKGEVLKTFEIQKRLVENSKLAIKTVGVIEQEEVKLSKSIDEIVYNSILSVINNKDFSKDVLNISSGSYSQREYFFYNYKKEIKQQFGYSINQLSHDILAFNNIENAKAMQKIAHSLGLYAKLINVNEIEINIKEILKDNVEYLLHVRDVDYIKIERVTTTNNFEECQCIKVEAKDGLFITRDYVVTHNTETLLSLAFNTLVHGSGFIYVDGKGDNSLFMKIFSMLRSMGREDDLLTLNYMTGSRNVSGPQENKLSNTLNPFTTGTSNGLTELIVGLMGGGSGGGDGDMWKGRAISMVGAVMRALVWKRDNQNLLLDVEVLRDNILFENIQKLATDTDLPSEVVSSLNGYLQSLPGYVVGEETQESTTLEQHGFLMMQFTRILSSLSDDYGYIFKTNLGEIDFKDIILNNRVLCVLLPALEKSIDELANLGKIVVACLKIMMSAGLGDAVEGETSMLLDTKPTNSLSPYMCILDEYGYYVVTGAAVMPAQARSLGFSMVFAGQDYPSFKKNNNSEEASATIGNCNIKIFMKIEDPGDTFDLAKKSAGEATVARSTSQEKSTGVAGVTYNDTMNISFNKEARLDWLDVKSQTEGQAHIIFKSTMIRAYMFYANPKKPKVLRLNHFIKVEPPKKAEMDEYLKPVTDLERKINNKELIEDIISGAEDINIQLIGSLITEIGKTRTLNSSEVCAAVIAANLKSNDAVLKNLLAETEDSIYDTTKTKVNIYAEDDNEEDEDDSVDFNHTQYSISKAFGDTFDLDNESALLRENKLAKNVEEIEKHSSSSNDKDVKNKSKQFVDEVSALTSYPVGDIPNEQTESSFMDSLESLLEEIKADL
jgi:hypothetical protein